MHVATNKNDERAPLFLAISACAAAKKFTAELAVTVIKYSYKLLIGRPQHTIRVSVMKQRAHTHACNDQPCMHVSDDLTSGVALLRGCVP